MEVTKKNLKFVVATFVKVKRRANDILKKFASQKVKKQLEELIDKKLENALSFAGLEKELTPVVKQTLKRTVKNISKAKVPVKLQEAEKSFDRNINNFINKLFAPFKVVAKMLHKITITLIDKKHVSVPYGEIMAVLTFFISYISANILLTLLKKAGLNSNVFFSGLIIVLILVVPILIKQIGGALAKKANSGPSFYVVFGTLDVVESMPEEKKILASIRKVLLLYIDYELSKKVVNTDKVNGMLVVQTLIDVFLHLTPVEVKFTFIDK